MNKNIIHRHIKKRIKMTKTQQYYYKTLTKIKMKAEICK